MGHNKIVPERVKEFESICKDNPFLEAAIISFVDKLDFYRWNPSEYNMNEIQRMFFMLLREQCQYTFESGYMQGYDDCLSDLDPDDESAFTVFLESTKYKTEKKFKPEDFLKFIRGEMPDVFKALLKEYRKKAMEESDD